MSRRVIEARHGLAGAAVGGQRVTEVRHGLAGASREWGGVGGHFVAPHNE